MGVNRGRRALVAASMAVLGSPLSAFAQRRRAARVGYLSQRRTPFLLDPLLAALRARGWAAGGNLLVDAPSAEGDYDRATALAERLVEHRCDVIVVVGTHMALAAQRASRSIPIVMYLSGFPVEGGLVESFARPGGNITGLATYSGEAFFTKHVSLMRELVPSLREFGILWDYLPPMFLEKEAEFGMHALRTAARELKVKTRLWPVPNEQGLDAALAELAKAPAEVVFATTGPVHGAPSPGAARLIEFTHKRRLRLACDIAGSLFRAGGLLAYSASWQEAAERCASFVDRVLKGANPAELPIERPTKFELVLNLKTAKAIGARIPPAMLARADQVLE